MEGPDELADLLADLRRRVQRVEEAAGFLDHADGAFREELLALTRRVVDAERRVRALEERLGSLADSLRSGPDDESADAG